MRSLPPMSSWSVRALVSISLTLATLSAKAADEAKSGEAVPAAPGCGAAVTGTGVPDARFTRRQVLTSAGVAGVVGLFLGRSTLRGPKTRTPITDAVPVMTAATPRLGPPSFRPDADGALQWGFPWPKSWDRKGPAPAVTLAEEFLRKPGAWGRLAAFPDRAVRFVLSGELARESFPVDLVPSGFDPIGARYVAPKSEHRYLAADWHHEPTVVVNDAADSLALLVGYAEAVFDREIFPEARELPRLAKLPRESVHPVLWSRLLHSAVEQESLGLERNFAGYLESFSHTEEGEAAYRLAIVDAAVALHQLSYWGVREPLVARAVVRFYLLERSLLGELKLTRTEQERLALSLRLLAGSIARDAEIRAKALENLRAPTTTSGVSGRSLQRLQTLAAATDFDLFLADRLENLADLVLGQQAPLIPQQRPAVPPQRPDA